MVRIKPGRQKKLQLFTVSQIFPINNSYDRILTEKHLGDGTKQEGRRPGTVATNPKTRPSGAECVTNPGWIKTLYLRLQDVKTAEANDAAVFILPPPKLPRLRPRMARTAEIYLTISAITGALKEALMSALKKSSQESKSQACSQFSNKHRPP